MRLDYAPAMLTLLLIAACGDGRSRMPLGSTDGGAVADASSGTDAGEDSSSPLPDAATGCDCADDEVCVEGTCMALPDMCPCPIESYCDVASNTCTPGCTSDEGCSVGRICDGDRRACLDGCRDDSACGAGLICQAELCVTGCRNDSGCETNEVCESMLCRAGCTTDGMCGGGEICESLRCQAGCRNDEGCAGGEVCEDEVCRAGCRLDSDCGDGAVCVSSTLSCATCALDMDEDGDTTVATTRSSSRTVDRVLCGTEDSDRVVWTSNPNPGYYRTRAWIDVTGAASDGVTTVMERISGISGTREHTVTGSGMIDLVDDSYDYYCFEGRCAQGRRTYTATSTSEQPVSLEFNVRVSATR